MERPDFGGWATKVDIRCSDGRTIRKGAFKHNDGQKVPLVWNHQHNDPDEVLGHALLENHDEGVYAYGFFNDTESGQKAKELVRHRDITALSIYANQLKQHGGDVVHGTIREVSLVMAGANPGAFIDSFMAHAEESEDSAVIYTGEEIVLSHAEKEEETKEMATETKEVQEETLEHAEQESGKTVKEVFDSMTEEQKTVVYAMIGQALEDASGDDEDDEESEGGNETMKHNVFDQDEMMQENVISHSDMMAVITDAKRYGSMKESALQHGIDQIDYLFPEAKSLNTPPEFIQREMGWVKKVLGGVHHTPFSRIKSMFADITEDEARARGYIKGNYKKEEVFGLLKRTTTPTTIYKKQKLDRDDVIDITDFDVVAWLKGEMRMMLDEEIARAILVGDGRPTSSDDKIPEMNIRPVWTDEDLYTLKTTIEMAAGSSDDKRAKAFIRAVIKSRKNYKGSGNPTLYTTEDVITDCMLMEDNMGRVIYESREKLKSVLGVSEIVTVPVMEGLKRTNAAGDEVELMGLIVNLKDYNVGADKGGAVNMFDDFDIDYNAQKYLIETRCSGALIKPFSAIALELKTVSAPATNG